MKANQVPEQSDYFMSYDSLHRLSTTMQELNITVTDSAGDISDIIQNEK